jgi:hypothetical protein
MLLNTGITKFAFITQNNHVYEYTAESLTPEVLLNVRSPYRRQKRDFSIIRLSFRRPYWNRNICNHTDYLTFLPITSTTLLPSCDWLFLTSYLLIFLPHYRFFPIFLRPYRLFLIFFSTTSTISYLFTFLRLYRLSAIDIHIVDLSKITHTRSVNQNRVRFAMPRHGKLSS